MFRRVDLHDISDHIDYKGIRLSITKHDLLSRKAITAIKRVISRSYTHFEPHRCFRNEKTSACSPINGILSLHEIMSTLFRAKLKFTMLIRRVASPFLSRAISLANLITSARRNNTRSVIGRLLDEPFNHRSPCRHFNFKLASNTHPWNFHNGYLARN